MGQLILIRGNKVSFYIPPTGVEVVKDGGNYVRQAETLERLEYCLLVDQNGKKRYVRGADVVFPKPTESFKLNDDGDRKNKAYELNEKTGSTSRSSRSTVSPRPRRCREARSLAPDSTYRRMARRSAASRGRSCS